MFRNLSKICSLRSPLRLLSTSGRVYSNQLKTNDAGNINDQLSPVFAKTFIDPKKDFLKTVIKDGKGEMSLSQLMTESRRVSQQISALIGRIIDE